MRERQPRTFRFRDDGEVPNSPWPLLVYRSAVRLDGDYDPAAIFEALFAHNGWRGSWRDGMYDWLHYHSNTHEVLGVARGWLHARFGGRNGRRIAVKAGDVIVLPAGLGHYRLRKARDLLIVGAYPNAKAYDECEPKDTDGKVRRSAARVRLPRRDPVYGANGPLFQKWNRSRS
ncbi:MAG: cupin domain-containing protein [Rhizomicrobium sp.]